MARSQPGHDLRLARRAGGQADVTAFALERHRATRCRDQSRDAKPRPRTDQADGGAGLRLATADALARLLGQPWQPQGERGEVVHHPQPLQAERCAQRSDREAPRVVGHRDLVTTDRRGDPERGHCGQRSAGLREPGLQGLARADKVCAVQAAQRARCRAGVRDECKADVGAANVRDQARPGGGGGGSSRGSFGHGVFRHGEERRRSRRRNQTARLAA